MLKRPNLRFNKGKWLFGTLLLLLIIVICMGFDSSGNDDFDIARREILIRKIGHELLLQSGDSSSRVLPLQKLSDNEYQISFEKPLGFLPDSLVNTTQRLMDKDAHVSDYVVNVLNCGTDQVAYGYAISHHQKDDIVSCKGRMLPVACYTILIKFKSDSLISTNSGYLLGSLPILAFVGLLFFRVARTKKDVVENTSLESEQFQLGDYLFDAKQRKLVLNDSAIDLTATETRVLRIFADSPNEVIERNRIQKEIWEDEGVIVGRSLDMFISKLRRKLEMDERVKIVVIRGVGYRLEIG
jgi:Transcriptional regulatory protein, C terminal